MPVLECSRCNELYYSADGSSAGACDACGGTTWRVFEDEVSFVRVADLPRRLGPGDHAAVLYTDPEDAAGVCADCLRDGLAEGWCAVLAVPDDLRDAVLGRLGPEAAGRIEVLSAATCYDAFDAATVAERFASLARESEAPMTLVCGPDPASVADVAPEEWSRYERICHELVLGLGATALCAYDGRKLPIAFTPVGVQVHPLISHAGSGLTRNADFAYEPPAA